MEGHAFSQCTACSAKVIQEYLGRGWAFVQEAIQVGQEQKLEVVGSHSMWNFAQVFKIAVLCCALPVQTPQSLEELTGLTALLTGCEDVCDVEDEDDEDEAELL